MRRQRDDLRDEHADTSIRPHDRFRRPVRGFGLDSGGAAKNNRAMKRWTACPGVAAVLMLLLARDVPAQPRARDPLPPGQRFDARDGDTIVVEDNARVRILRRRHGHVRAIFNPAQRWLVLVATYSPLRKGDTERQAEEAFTFNQVTGDWPLDERWEGDAVVETYAVAGESASSHGVGLETPRGLLQLIGPSDQPLFGDVNAVATLSYSGAGRGGARGSFDYVERQQVAIAMNNAALRRDASTSLPRVSTSSEIRVSVPGSTGAASEPVRVGGVIAMPSKVHDVRPILPDVARQAGIRGTVILEVTIGVDGSVADARILRSIPLLDAAALDAVRQWRYEPTLLNGTAVPVRFTVTVEFP